MSKNTSCCFTGKQQDTRLKTEDIHSYAADAPKDHRTQPFLPAQGTATANSNREFDGITDKNQPYSDP